MPRIITPAELIELRAGTAAFCLVDVSERGEYNLRHIDEAAPVPRGDIEWRIRELVPDRGALVVLYCEDGKRSLMAAETLDSMGYKDVRYLEGGLEAWCAAGQEAFFGWGVRGKEYGEKVSVTEPVGEITADELAAARDRGDPFIIVDSRTPEEYELGHLPGAYSAPGGELAFHVLDLLSEFAGEEPTVVVNCAGRTRSLLGAHLLTRMGISKVVALKNGSLAWGEAGHRIDTGPDPRKSYTPSKAAQSAAAEFAEKIRDEEKLPSISPAQLREMQRQDQLHYLIDVRLPEEYGVAHISGAFSCTLGQLAFFSEELVGVRGAPVIVYGNREVRSIFAASLYARMGLTNTMVLEGGMEAWRALDFPISSGAAPRPIGRPEREVPEPARPPEVITVEDLERGLAGATPPIVIDVRGIGDYALGHIAGSRWLSRSYLEFRIAEDVPDRNSEIVVVDADGIRGPMSAATLDQMGYSRVAVLKGGILAWRGAGKAVEGGLGDAPSTLDIARWDGVDPFQRRDALSFSSDEIKKLMDWEIALGEKYHKKG